MSSTIIKPTNHATSFKTNDEMTEKIAASTNVITAIVTLKLIDFLKYGFMVRSVYSLCYVRGKGWSFRRAALRLRSSRFSEFCSPCYHVGGSPLNSSKLRRRKLDWITT